jgi:phosphatidate cytidylyltransferase
MKKRIVFGAIMIAALVGLFWLDWWLEQTQPSARVLTALPVTVLLALLGGVAFLEIARFGAASGLRLLKVSGMVGVLLVGTSPYWSSHWIERNFRFEMMLVLLGLLTLGVFVEQMARYRVEDALRRVGGTLLPIVYLGIGGALLLQTRIAFGLEALILLLVAVKLTDIGAYFTGSFLGRHKMIPWLSPGKSWEGLAGGLAVAAGASILTAWLLDVPLALWQAALFGVLVGGFGQLADLCESLLKRSAGVKDSGALVPEFGGVMDIIDSPLLAAPVGFLLLGLMMLS